MEHRREGPGTVGQVEDPEAPEAALAWPDDFGLLPGESVFLILSNLIRSSSASSLDRR